MLQSRRECRTGEVSVHVLSYGYLFRTTTYSHILSKEHPRIAADGCSNTTRNLDLRGFDLICELAKGCSTHRQTYQRIPISTAPNSRLTLQRTRLHPNIWSLVQRLCTPHHPMGYARAPSWSVSSSTSRISRKVTDHLGMSVTVASEVPIFPRRRFC